MEYYSFPEYTVLCEEENKCITEDEPCGHKCISPDVPIWAPWGRDPRARMVVEVEGTSGTCLTADYAEEYCTTTVKCYSGETCYSTEIPNYSMYMCNGLCIPAIIPCNNKCLNRVEYVEGKSERLFGPVTCHGSIRLSPDSRDFWTKSLQPDALAKVQEIIGHSDSDLGVCLPGSIPCNETCILDPDRPVKVWKDGEILEYPREYQNEGLISVYLPDREFCSAAGLVGDL